MTNNSLGRVFLAATVIGTPINAVAADRLPFPDGSYASMEKFCQMGKEKAHGEYEFAFYDIRGKEISNYEMWCEIRNVSVKGNAIKFKRICESEGESSVAIVNWKKLSDISFSDETGNTWIGCGRFVD